MHYLLPFFTVCIWGANTIVNKMAASVIEPSAMSFYRWFVAMLILTPFCVHSVIKQWSVISPNLPKLAFLALLGMALNQSLGYYAGLTTTASNMALITSLVPLVSIFISVPLLNKSISGLSMLGGIVSLGGLAFMLGKGDPLFFLDQKITQGDGYMLISIFVYASYCVLLKRWKMPISNWVVIYVQVVFAVLMLAVPWLTSDHLLPPKEALPLITYAAIAASVLAPWMWVKSINIIGADSSAMFMNLIPVVAIALATTWLGEKLELFHLLGGVMVILGVILAQLKLTKRFSS